MAGRKNEKQAAQQVEQPDRDTTEAADSEIDELPFEEALTRLEQIVGRLESGDIPLDEALQEYAVAVKLIRRCHQVLDKAERQIEVLTGVDAEGNPIVAPISEEDIDLEEAEEAQASRRGRRK